MFIEKIINKKRRVIFIGISIIILFGVIGGGYYWWTGTPEYSISQIKKAIETHNSELGLKYIDTDAIFEHLWTDMKSELIKETTEAEGFEAFGMMFGLQMAESMKPALKEQVKEGIKSWFVASTEEKPKEATITTKEGLETGTFWQKDLKIKKQGNSAYIELPDNVKIVLTKKVGERYWVISKIEGFMETSPATQSSEILETPAKQGKEKEIEKKVGDEIELATIKFKVTSVEEKQVLAHTTWGITATAKEGAKFVVIGMNITNITNKSFDFFPDNIFRFIDNKGREFETYEGSIGAIDNYLNVRKLSPNIKESGFLIYELPKDATSYSLVVGKAGTNEVYKVLLEPTQPVKGGESQIKESKPQTQPVTQKVYNIGDRIQIEDVVVYVKSFSDYEITGEFLQPKVGNKYVSAEISLVNIGSEPMEYDMYMFVLKDKNEKIYPYALAQKEPILGGTLKPWGKTLGVVGMGYITWEIPKDASGFQLVISFPWFTERPVVNLGK